MSVERRERPVGLWVIAIIAILLGGLGSCAGTFGVASIATQDRLAELQRDIQQDQPNEEMRRLNVEMQDRVQEIARAWRIPSLIGNVANLLASFLLMIAAILLLRWHPNAGGIFIGAIVFSIIADLIVGGVGVAVSQQTMVVMEDFGRRVGEASGDPAAERVMGGAMKAGSAFGVCFAIGWLIAKLGFYVSALIYLRRQSVRVLFR